jgi:poly(hydroxyalkanoate) granule-associated protein
MAKIQRKAQAETTFAQAAKESTQQVWLAGLGAIAKAKEEGNKAITKAQQQGNKAFDKLVKEGENIQKQTRKVADEKIALVSSKASDSWGRMEKVFEDRVARALSSLGVPSKKDIDTLSKRITELTAAVQKLSKGQEVAAPKLAKLDKLPEAA